MKVFTTTGDPLIEEHLDVGYQTEGDLPRWWREKPTEPIVTMTDRDSRLHLIPTAHIVGVVLAPPEGRASAPLGDVAGPRCARSRRSWARQESLARVSRGRRRARRSRHPS